MLKQLPNLVTLFNLLAGCLSVIFLFNGDMALASWMIGLAAVFDFMDGLLARLLKASSELGKVLDSLADVVSFGIAPGFIIFKLLQFSGDYPEILAYISLMIPTLSAVRLAIFSTDERQQDHFIGVPTPLNALMLASIPLILIQYQDNPVITGFFYHTWTLVAITVFSSLMLVAPIRIMAMKFKSYAWNKNRLKYFVVLISAALLVTFGYLALPAIYILFLITSILSSAIDK